MLKLRVARPTDNLKQIASMYCKGLDFTVLSQFSGHDGFDGIIIGKPNSPYHIEFTSNKKHELNLIHHPDDLLVFYEPSPESFTNRIEKMQNAGFECVTSFNPFWDNNGATFKDTDGRRVVVVNGNWNK